MESKNPSPEALAVAKIIVHRWVSTTDYPTPNLIADVAQALQENLDECQRLREALKRYGRHEVRWGLGPHGLGCKWPAHKEHEDECYATCELTKDGEIPCSCGLDDALKGGTP